ncbi:histidine kinase dimerization/phospho-acceptor domain-containing protein [Aliiglaciecola sp. LCG003]|uniref:histidine kinase dimerization/phospho-acceptor domain-containing protein n=1 Tax=Aliiglaciecola sp. LCG003 TaxID=3053655 RepID=UPI0025724420|nr:histidine kinase dimerization/phospho-acceptor domain-containing protein [Aliiglaciecola sp. LCG003]WJG09207.1 histidine kinase [Aliiglaciecola sp. LCG003]
MKSIEEAEFNQFIHSVRNPLNSISLHAELGKMLIENQASTEEIKHAFTVILQQCKCCEQVIGDMRKNTHNDS